MDAFVGLVGLGLMGTAMSTRLLAGGRRVVGFDVSADAREAHRARGGDVASSPADVAARCRVVILSLPSGQISRSVCLHPDGLAEAGQAGMVVVETSTPPPSRSRNRCCRPSAVRPATSGAWVTACERSWSSTRSSR